MRVTVAAPAKVNLWLRIGERRPSGYHELDTLFCSLHLADSVVVRPGDGELPTLDVVHARPLRRAPDLGPAEDNLAIRAARAFQAHTRLETAPAIRLVKRIPAGAGLGGGSSDAAAVLRALARLNPGLVTGDELMGLGAEIGSDVPFFVRGAALARGLGRGERVTPLAPLPGRSVVIARPAFPIATAAAYGWLDEDRPEASLPDPADPPPEPDWDVIAGRAVNDFEGPVFRRHPELATLRGRLMEHGARPALLAGSGSTVFGVFEEKSSAREVARQLRASDPETRVLVTRTRTR